MANALPQPFCTESTSSRGRRAFDEDTKFRKQLVRARGRGDDRVRALIAVLPVAEERSDAGARSSEALAKLVLEPQAAAASAGRRKGARAEAEPVEQKQVKEEPPKPKPEARAVSPSEAGRQDRAGARACEGRRSVAVRAAARGAPRRQGNRTARQNTGRGQSRGHYAARRAFLDHVARRHEQRRHQHGRTEPQHGRRRYRRSRHDEGREPRREPRAWRAARRSAAARATRPRAAARRSSACSTSTRARSITLYNRALRQNPALQGKLVLKLTIEPDGRVSACEVVSSELGDKELEQKLVQRVLLFQFEKRDVETHHDDEADRLLPGLTAADCAANVFLRGRVRRRVALGARTSKAERRASIMAA